MKNIHTAEFRGRTFKRTTDSRIYKFAIVERRSAKADREREIAGTRHMFKINLSYHTAIADGTSEFLQRASYEHDDAKYAQRVVEDQARSREWLAGGVERHVADINAAYDHRDTALHLDADGDTYYVCTGWTTGATRPKANQFYVDAKVVSK